MFAISCLWFMWDEDEDEDKSNSTNDAIGMPPKPFCVGLPCSAAGLSRTTGSEEYESDVFQSSGYKCTNDDRLNSPNDAKGLPCSVAGVLRTTRDDEPAHYILKIESFSLLSSAGIKEYESEVFKAGGYKWRLLFYPEGNEKEDGKNHISLYLAIVDSTKLTTGWNVHVYFTLFVYDHALKNYLTFQGVADGKKTQFHAMKTKSGFSKLLSLDCFKDSSNGYLYNDSCVFGAEVFVTSKCAEMGTCLSMIEPPSWNNTYSWVVEKFSTIQDYRLESEEFKVGKLKWKLILFPKGKGVVNSKQLTVYLELSDCSSFPLGWRFYAKFKLRMRDQVGHNHLEIEISLWFCDSIKARGFRLLGELEEPFLVNDNIIIEAEISVVGTIRNST